MKLLKNQKHFYPSEKGLLVKADLVDVDVDDLIVKWLKYVRNQTGLSFTDNQIENIVARHSPEQMLRGKLD